MSDKPSFEEKVEDILKCMFPIIQAEKVYNAKTALLALFGEEVEKFRVPYMRARGHSCPACERATVINETIDNIQKSIDGRIDKQ